MILKILTMITNICNFAFLINVFNCHTKQGKLKKLIDEEIRYGFYYCENWSKYYNLETGLDQEEFKRTVGEREVLFV